MPDEKTEEEKIPPWTDRNDILKVIKATGDYGWLHLVIAERKSDKQKFMRLKRYKNWFAIPSVKYLKYVQEMLVEGTKELGWDTNIAVEPLKIVDGIQKKADDERNVSKEILETIPEEVLEFIQNNPKATIKLISAIKIEKLDDDDIEYLKQLIEILSKSVLRANKKLKLSFQELLGRITKEKHEGMDKLSELMNTWSLVQITSLTQLIQERLNAIEMFEKVIHDEKTYELKSNSSIHRILEKSMWLIDENYWMVMSNKSLRTFIGDELVKIDAVYKDKRPDFVCVQAGKKLIIVEIKRPSLEIGKKELDQIELYLRLIKKYKGENYSSINAYLIGNKISQEAREVLEFRTGIKLLTYQDIIESNRYKYQEFLKIVEESK